MFCQNCADLLETFKNFKQTCYSSLDILVELLQTKATVGKIDFPSLTGETIDKLEPMLMGDDYDQDNVAVKVEPIFASDDDNEESDRESNDGDDDYVPGEEVAEYIEDEEDEKSDSNAEESEEDESSLGDESKAGNTDKKTKKSGNRRKKRLKGDKEKNCHKCTECDKAFPRPANLRNHFLKKHRGAKHCKYCQKAFEVNDEYLAHMKMEEERMKVKKTQRQKVHVCEVCGLTTRFRSNLVKHMDTHLPDDNCVKCDICHKSFKSLMLLKNHIMYHKEKTYECNTCSRKFLFSKDLERHQRLVHEKLTEYTTCTICNKQVSAKGLNSHVKQVHMDIRPHTCQVCNVAFKSSSNLKKHLYSHSGTRPYNCHLCGHGSYMSCTLKEHYQKIHSLNYTNDELNKVCIKVKPGILTSDSEITAVTARHSLEDDDEDALLSNQAIIISTDASGISQLKSETGDAGLDIGNLQLTYTSLPTVVGSADEFQLTSSGLSNDVQKYEK